MIIHVRAVLSFFNSQGWPKPIFSQKYQYSINRTGKQNWQNDHQRGNAKKWSFNKFSQLVLKEMYRDHKGEFVCGY